MHSSTKRLSIWAVAVALLLTIPLILTLTGSGVDGDGWHWTLGDFIFAFVLFFGAGLTYELVAKKMSNTTYRFAVGLAVVTAVLLVWTNAAVGIIGDGDNGTNMIYLAVLALGLLGAILTHFEPRRMARVVLAMALALALIPVIALFTMDRQTWGPPGVLGVFVLNTFFVMLFAGSALLFRRASAMDPRRELTT